MKVPTIKYLVYIFILLPFQLFSQIKLVDEKEGTAIPYAHIFLDKRFYTYSNEKGEFTIAAKQKFDTLKIGHLSYETKLLAYNDLKSNVTIALTPKVNVLEEVMITSKNKKRKTKILLPEKTTRDLLYGRREDMRLIYEDGISGSDEEENTELVHLSRAIYVPNEKPVENARITKIILRSVDKETKGDAVYKPFRVNLMTYDTINKLPKEKIFAEDLLVGKKKGQELVIDLSKGEFVQFPKEGICVMVSVYHTKYYINAGFNRPPAFKITLINEKSGFREYCMWSGKTWEEPFYSKERIQCFDFGVEIEFSE